MFTATATPGYALSATQSDSIETLLNEACRKSGVPGMSISIIADNETLYYSSGYADREKKLAANENTLYELASVSKAFTAAGILLMEEHGLLSMTDPIQKHLPWFSVKYQGKPINMQSLTLGNFLHHTSGLTNSSHIQKIPQGTSPDMLQKTVEMLVDTELNFLPGAEYNYGTVNYDVLGLVIETVSGQSYEEFMKQQVLQPLGLHNTYVYKKDAQANGRLAQGYRSSFLITSPYNAPDYAGNKPAGYIISCSKDMARWMGIHMGIVQDIPEIFHKVIEKSHQGDLTVEAVNEMSYAGGWTVNTGQTIIEHAGQNPNFSTFVTILTEERKAICLLTNGANTNINLVLKIKAILDGSVKQSYEISAMQILDIFLSSVTMIFLLLAVFFFFLGLRRIITYKRQAMKNKQLLITYCWLAASAVIGAVCFALPMLFKYDWATLLVWQTYSILSALISIFLLMVSVTWFFYSRRFNTSRRK